MFDPSLLLAGSATSLLTVEGIWTVARMKAPVEESSTNPQNQITRENICVVFPCYKDVVEISKWLAWGDSSTRFIIVEDIHNGNRSRDPRVAIYQRNHRNGFKAGAINFALEELVKLSQGNPAYFDYILFFDADHVPLEPLARVRSELRKLEQPVVAQFFWYDGLPRKRAIDCLTYSARIYANYNAYNRAKSKGGFSNLTGSAMAISFPLILKGLRFPDSITEDYALSLALIGGKHQLEVIPLVISFGKSPKNFKEFVRQQERWAEGTIRDAIDNFHVLKRLSWEGRADFLLHANMYAQALWILVSAMTLFFLGIRLDLIAVILMGFQLGTFLATMREAPKRFWPYYLVLNYVLAPFQIYACMKGLVKTTGRFYRTPKFGGT